MLIYHTSHTERAGFEPCDCPRDSLDREAHVCFTNTPIAGYGPWVAVLDMPEHEVRRYEYDKAHHSEDVRFFALPLSVVEGYRVRSYTYEALTGSDWRRWTVTLRNPSALHGKWAQIWVSRVGVAIARRYTEGGVEKADIELTDFFDPNHDYVVLESKMFEGRQFELQLLAGSMPEWADFPQRWYQWANDPDIRAEAIGYLQHVAPPSVPHIEDAETGFSDKLDKIERWRRVARSIQEYLGRRDLDNIRTGSWTSVQAIPMRMAERLGWTPSVPRPTHGSTDGRVCLAAPAEEPVNRQAGLRTGGAQSGVPKTTRPIRAMDSRILAGCRSN